MEKWAIVFHTRGTSDQHRQLRYGWQCSGKDEGGIHGNDESDITVMLCLPTSKSAEDPLSTFVQDVSMF